MTIKEYWNLIGRQQFLAITSEPDFSQACNFCRMLMYHKNFHFTQFPDKTNDITFLKSPKTMFWVIFDHFFAWWGLFYKKSSFVTHIYIWAPNTMLSFRKKLMSQSWENRLLVEAGGPIKHALAVMSYGNWSLEHTHASRTLCIFEPKFYFSIFFHKLNWKHSF